MRKSILWAATALATAYGGAAAQAAAADTIVVQWNDVTLANVRTTHPGPPIVARMLMIVDTCMYNAWTAFDPVASPTIGTAVTGIAKQPVAQVSEGQQGRGDQLRGVSGDDRPVPDQYRAGDGDDGRAGARPDQHQHRHEHAGRRG